MTPLRGLLRQATRRAGEPLNILTFPTHESYCSAWADSPHQFYLFRGKDIKDWNSVYRKVPRNHTLLDPNKGVHQIPPDVDFDLILSQNKAGQLQAAQYISKIFHIPIISLEHTLPVPQWNDERLAQIKNNPALKGNVQVFLSEFSRRAWKWEGEDCRIVPQGIDTDIFSIDDFTPRKPHILSIVNDWQNRDVWCGFYLWRDISHDLPVVVLGDNPGLSKPAANLQELVDAYRSAQIFLNTSLVSSCPYTLLEAMACGCCVISTATTMIPEVIESGVNGLCSNDPKQLRAWLKEMLDKPDECRAMGERARETIVNRFGVANFLKNWDKVFYEAANTIMHV